MEDIREALCRRILVLDGAMGTMIESRRLEEEDYRGSRFRDIPGRMRGDNDILNLTRPDIVADIHRRYLRAGADIIETNTFCSQRVSQRYYHCESYCAEMAFEGARIARRAADEYSAPSHPRFVAGSVGPTLERLSSSACLSHDSLSRFYSEQIDAMIQGGVDVILIETITDIENAECAIAATPRDIPVMLSLSAGVGGHAPQALADIVTHHDNILSVGINCSFGAKAMIPFLRRLARGLWKPYLISAYPGAGPPGAEGRYSDTSLSMASYMKQMVDEQLVNIIGGCCGTTDAFIRLLAPIARRGTPHNQSYEQTIIN